MVLVGKPKLGVSLLFGPPRRPALSPIVDPPPLGLSGLSQRGAAPRQRAHTFTPPRSPSVHAIQQRYAWTSRQAQRWRELAGMACGIVGVG